MNIDVCFLAWDINILQNWAFVRDQVLSLCPWLQLCEFDVNWLHTLGSIGSLFVFIVVDF